MNRLLLASLAIALLPAVAAAQSQAVNPNAMRSASPLDTNRINGMERMQQLHAERERRRMDRASADTAERRERAERLSAMVNNGQCRAAYEAAVAEHDRDMAERIRQVCASPAAEAAAPSAPEAPGAD